MTQADRFRQATPADIPALTAFFAAHLESSMFLMGNLLAHGVAGSDHPHATTFLLRDTASGLSGVLGMTRGGFLLCQIPGLSLPDARVWAGLLQGYPMAGINGQSDQVAALLAALPLRADALRLNRAEPLYALALGLLPDPAPVVRRATLADVPLLTTWFAAYMADTGTTPAGDRGDTALARAEAAVWSDDLALLDEGAPVAMAAINARAGDAVQVGGVYVPPALRGAGRAGRVVAGLLAEHRARGATRAILFAASPDAARAYEKIGFVRIGDYRIALLGQPVTLGRPA